jgi:hypothetical protein
MARYRLIKAILLGLFFVSTLALSFGVPRIFNSPDENANWQFAHIFSQTGTLSISEADNLTVDGLLHPRSVLAIDDKLVPNSFLGLPVLAGVVGRLLGDQAMLLVTPMLALLAIIAWRSLVWRLFDDTILADLAAFFLAVHPAFWYYSGRVMMHNVAFVAFLIFTVWFVVRRPWSKFGRIDWNYVASGLMLGLAIATRASEIFWVLSLALIIWFIYRAQINWRQLGALSAGAMIALVPFAFLNQEIYGDIFTTGYTVSEITATIANPTTVATTNQFVSAISKIYHFLFPFGVHELATLRHVWGYGFLLYPWLSFLSAVGLLIALFADRLHAAVSPHLPVEDRRWRQSALLTLLLAAYLGVLYGSWNINDNPDPAALTIANSYARYWLPLFVLGSLFAALAVRFAVRRFGYHRWYLVCVGATLLVVLISSAQTVWGGEDGFLSTRQHFFEFNQKRASILSMTEDNSIIIVDRADKYLWPERRVVVPLRSKKTYDHLSDLVSIAPVYYFGITLPENDLEYLQTTVLDEQGLKIASVQAIGEESLYLIYD